MISVYSFAYKNDKNEVNDKTAYNIVKRFEKSNMSTATFLAIGAIVSLILLAGCIVAGNYFYLETIGGMKISFGCIPGMFVAIPFSLFCVGSVAFYLLS